MIPGRDGMKYARKAENISNKIQYVGPNSKVLTFIKDQKGGVL